MNKIKTLLLLILFIVNTENVRAASQVDADEEKFVKTHRQGISLSSMPFAFHEADFSQAGLELMAKNANNKLSAATIGAYAIGMQQRGFEISNVVEIFTKQSPEAFSNPIGPLHHCLPDRGMMSVCEFYCITNIPLVRQIAPHIPVFNLNLGMDPEIHDSTQTMIAQLPYFTGLKELKIVNPRPSMSPFLIQAFKAMTTYLESFSLELLESSCKGALETQMKDLLPNLPESDKREVRLLQAAPSTALNIVRIFRTGPALESVIGFNTHAWTTRE